MKSVGIVKNTSFLLKGARFNRAGKTKIPLSVSFLNFKNILEVLIAGENSKESLFGFLLSGEKKKDLKISSVEKSIIKNKGLATKNKDNVKRKVFNFTENNISQIITPVFTFPLQKQDTSLSFSERNLLSTLKNLPPEKAFSLILSYLSKEESLELPLKEYEEGLKGAFKFNIGEKKESAFLLQKKTGKNPLQSFSYSDDSKILSTGTTGKGKIKDGVTDITRDKTFTLQKKEDLSFSERNLLSTLKNLPPEKAFSLILSYLSKEKSQNISLKEQMPEKNKSFTSVVKTKAGEESLSASSESNKKLSLHTLGEKVKDAVVKDKASLQKQDTSLSFSERNLLSALKNLPPEKAFSLILSYLTDFAEGKDLLFSLKDEKAEMNLFPSQKRVKDSVLKSKDKEGKISSYFPEGKLATKIFSSEEKPHLTQTSFKETIDQIVQRIELLRVREQNRASFLLKLKDLGNLHVHLAMDKNELTLHIQVSEAKIGNLIQENFHYLKHTLEKEGIFLREFTMDLGQGSQFSERDKPHQRNFSPHFVKNRFVENSFEENNLNFVPMSYWIDYLV